MSAPLRLVPQPPPNRQERLTSLRLDELSDRELLHVILDLRDAAGVVTSGEIAERLDPDHPHPTNCVGIRLGWLRRYGAVAYAPDGKPGWVLTDVGERIATGGLRAAQQRMLDELGGEQGLDAAIALGGLYHRLGQTEATLLRRGWQYASSPKRRR